MTLVIAYLSLVLGELVPKRLALQRSSALALTVAPPLDTFATLMGRSSGCSRCPPTWWYACCKQATLAHAQRMSEEELRDLVVAHEGLPDVEREILRDVFEAADRTLVEVMRPRHEVVFLEDSLTIAEAIAVASSAPYSRFPVKQEGDGFHPRLRTCAGPVPGRGRPQFARLRRLATWIGRRRSSPRRRRSR